MNQNTDRLIDEYIIGDYSLTKEDVDYPEDCAREIWNSLQKTNPDWFEDDETILVEGERISLSDFEEFIMDVAAQYNE